MLAGGLADALRRLDALLVRVCDAEERRAQRMYTEDRGWASLRASLSPAAAELAFDPMVPETPLAPRGALPSIDRLVDALGLDTVEADALVVLLAPHLEPRYGKLYTVLHDDAATPHATERLLFAMLGRAPARWQALHDALGDDGRLVGPGLVVRATGWHAPRLRPLELAPEIRDALLGGAPPVGSGDHALRWRPEPVAPPLTAPAPLLVVWGPGDCLGEAERATGGATATARPTTAPPPATLEAWWRAAVVHGAALVVDTTGLTVDDARRVAEAAARIARWGGAIALAAREPLPVIAPHRHAPAPNFEARCAAWRARADAHGMALPAAAIDRLAGNHPFVGQQLDAVFAVAGGAAELNATAFRLRREEVHHAQLLTPTRRFDELVLRASTRDALERLTYFVAHRDAVAARAGVERRFRLRQGPVVLFAGRSGTGKTLAAEVVATTLERPLAIVELSRLVSKYIGETEKHIDEILRAAERSGAVLFFDEADALFSSRTEVTSSTDRYANLEVGYLLQRIEQHDGLVILATNLRHAIDEAFLRRFHARIEFPFPDAGERAAIWSLFLPPDLDAAALGHHRLAGGDIRNAALKALFLAERDGAPLAMAHVERAIALELFELGRLSRHGDATSDAGRLCRDVIEALEATLERQLARRFLKEIHFVHGAPTKETLAGRRPALSIAVFRMVADGDGALRLGLVLSAWSNRPEEEIELLGTVQGAVAQLRLPSQPGWAVELHTQRSYDFDLLHRFWSSHGHPVRPSLLVDVELRPT